jgi:hypothetical protein
MERRQQVLFWMIAYLPAAATFLIGIEVVSYATIPTFPLRLETDLINSYDPEIGYVPRANSWDHLVNLDPQGKAVTDYDVYTDRNGARVSQRGEQGPTHPDIVSIGCSFTWGHGVNNENTFTTRAAKALGLTSTNLAMASHGTTQAVQLLERYRDLAPRLVLYGFIGDHLSRNIRGCAPSLFPFCVDISRVASGPDRALTIEPPRSDGVARMLLHVQSQEHWLDPLTWVVHGVDIAVNRLYWAADFKTSPSISFQRAAFEYLLARMANATAGMGAKLVLVHLVPPGDAMADYIGKLSAKLGIVVVDPTKAYERYNAEPDKPLLFIPDDGHPSVAGHALIADEIVSFVQREGLLDNGAARAPAGTIR